MALKRSQKKPSSAKLSRDTKKLVALTGNPVWRAFSKYPVPQSTKTSIGLAARKALYALSNDCGEFEHFNELVVTAHASIVLAEQGYGAELLEDFNKALEAILMCRLQALQGQGYYLGEQAGQSVNVLLDLYEQQVELAGKDELAGAIVEGYRRASLASSHH
jgi:hypothetical protein